jgi:hypothetical protein
MFDRKQIQNIRNAFFKYNTGAERSKIIHLAQSLSSSEPSQAEEDAVYWSTIWFCSQPKNKEEFGRMYKEAQRKGMLIVDVEEEGDPAEAAPEGRRKQRLRKNKDG